MKSRVMYIHCNTIDLLSIYFIIFRWFLQLKIKLFTVQEYKVGEKIAFFKKSILKHQLIVLQLFGLFLRQ